MSEQRNGERIWDIIERVGVCMLTTQAAGSMNVAYANGSSGTLSTSFTLTAPLSGTWNVNQPIVRLTGSTACSP